MGELSDEELVYFRKIALKAAKTISSDDQVFEGAANHAVMALIENLDDIQPDKRAAWIMATAANDARRTGAKLHRDLAFGRQGTFPPPRQDDDGDWVPDKHYASLVDELHLGMLSPSAEILPKIVIEQALQGLSPEARFLIEARYVAGRSTKDIAAELGKEPGAIDVAIHRARKALALLLADDPRVS